MQKQSMLILQDRELNQKIEPRNEENEAINSPEYGSKTVVLELSILSINLDIKSQQQNDLCEFPVRTR